MNLRPSRFCGLALLLACSEYDVVDVEAPDLTDPGVGEAPPSEGDETGGFGDPPEWDTCSQGYLGSYYNLPLDHPDVLPEEGVSPPDSPSSLDWWDDSRLAFQQFESSLDFGSNWWPVDQGWEGDPGYFSARFTAWLRTEGPADLSVVLGSADDVWVMTDDEVLTSLPGIHAFNAQTLTLSLGPGIHPLTLLFAHRASEASGFRFRFLDEGVSICLPYEE